MAIAWYICGYKTIASAHHPLRYCAMDDFTSQIYGEGGAWSESECLGANALVKVRASSTLLNTIAGTAGYTRLLNKWVLSDTLSDLTQNQMNAVNAKLLNMGYAQAEINAAMGSTLVQWQTHTFLDLLNLICKRRVERISGTVRTCKPVSWVDREVA